MAGSAFKDARVAQRMSTDFVPVLVDFDAEKKLVHEHGITQVPTISYAMADLEVLDWSPDLQTADQLIAAFDSILADINEIEEGGDLVDDMMDEE
jgi:thioredoxin-like negative regulator of GroEL